MMNSMPVSWIAIGLMSATLMQESTAPPFDAQTYPVGEISLQDVVSFNPEYRERADNYVPKAEAVEFLRRFAQDVMIEVFYGGWCGDSRVHVPSYIKLLELANNAHITTTFIAVDNKKQEPMELTRARRIERVPTFIVYVKGREIGRIVETPEGSLEEHLVRILTSQ